MAKIRMSVLNRPTKQAEYSLEEAACLAGLTKPEISFEPGKLRNRANDFWVIVLDVPDKDRSFWLGVVAGFHFAQSNFYLARIEE